MLIIITLQRPLIIFPHPKILKLHQSILGNRKNRHINICILQCILYKFYINEFAILKFIYLFKDEGRKGQITQREEPVSVRGECLQHLNASGRSMCLPACSARAPSNRGNTLNPQMPPSYIIIYLRSVGRCVTEKIFFFFMLTIIQTRNTLFMQYCNNFLILDFFKTQKIVKDGKKFSIGLC